MPPMKMRRPNPFGSTFLKSSASPTSAWPASSTTSRSTAAAKALSICSGPECSWSSKSRAAKTLMPRLTRPWATSPGIAERDLPQLIVVCDFARFRVHDLANGQVTEFALADLHQHVRRLALSPGNKVQTIQAQDPVNIRAAEQHRAACTMPCTTAATTATRCKCCWCACCFFLLVCGRHRHLPARASAAPIH